MSKYLLTWLCINVQMLCLESLLKFSDGGTAWRSLRGNADGSSCRLFQLFVVHLSKNDKSLESISDWGQQNKHLMRKLQVCNPVYGALERNGMFIPVRDMKISWLPRAPVCETMCSYGMPPQWKHLRFWGPWINHLRSLQVIWTGCVMQAAC